MPVPHLNKDSFKTEVLDNPGVVFVDFYAEWCGPCKMTSPIIEELSQQMNNVKFVKINVDENAELASTYSVFSIPTIIIFKKGQPVSQPTNFSKEGLLQEINKVLST